MNFGHLSSMTVYDDDSIAYSLHSKAVPTYVSPVNPQTRCTEAYIAQAVTTGALFLYCPVEQKPEVSVAACATP